MTSEWSNPDLVRAYTEANKNAAANWYETDVNIPDIRRLLDIDGRPARLLDFGCGPGDFTQQLHRDYEVTGADASETMVRQAEQSYPDITFFAWDGSNALPNSVVPFEAITTKLTLEFIADLDRLARNLYDALTPRGKLVVSVMHPMLGLANNSAVDYWEPKPYETQIGTTGVHVTKVQHTIADYVNSFIDQGFTLKVASEPVVSDVLQEAYGLTAEQVRFPKRLNLLFVK